MLIPTITGPREFGEADFVLNTDFKCTTGTSGICYGIGTPNHALFVQLQQVLNQFSVKAKFSKLTLDGKIGARTVTAAQKAARYILSTIPGWSTDVLLGQVSAGTTKEFIASKVPTLVSAFHRAATGQDPIVATPASTTQPPAAQPPTAQPPTAQPPTAQPPTPSPLPLIFGRAAEVLDLCRTDPNQPLCDEARAACQQVAAAQTPMSRADADRVELFCAGLPAPVAAPVPAPFVPPAKPGRTIWWIVGGVAGAVILTGVVIAVARRPRSAPAVAGVRRRRRRYDDAFNGAT